jgi:hypothetical protein
MPTSSKAKKKRAPAAPAKSPARPSQAKARAKKATRAKTAAVRTRAEKPSIVRLLLRSWPPLGQPHRDAFLALVSDAECEVLGGRTKAEAVLKESEEWAPVIDRALRDFGYELRRYAPVRFVWLLECVRALEDAVRAQKAASYDEGELRRALDRAVLEGRDVLEDLVVALEVVATGRPDGERRVHAARAGIDEPEALTASLRAAADLADEYGQSYEMKTKALVASVALRAEDAHAARASAAQIEAAIAALSAGAGATAAEDLPSTNRVEGRVLAEMRFVKRMFDRARDADPRLPPLAAGPGTRAVVA